MSDLLIYEATAGKNRVETAAIQGRIDAAGRARKAGASESEIAGMLSGRPIPEKWKESITSIPGKQGEVTLIEGGRGAVQRVVPTPAAQKATKEQFAADVAKHGRAQALKLYAERNITPPKE
jgi:hypothetical protein